jgi:putative transposase
VRYAWIKGHDKEYAVAEMCRILQVSASGYYDSLVRKHCLRRQRRRNISDAAARFYFESKRIYGYRKVHEDLLECSIVCCRETVRRIMRDMGLYSRVKRKFVLTTDSEHNMAVADNLLNRDFAATEPNLKWAGDITYIPTCQGWLYLACVMDLFSRKIVGWSMRQRIDSDLVMSALRMAVEQRKPDAGLLCHSDRGSQYASDSYQDLLDGNGIICSMSRKGNCWDNACMESFFGSLKTEWLDGKKYQTHQEAKNNLFEYIEMFYNRKRRHAALGYLSPADYEKINEMKEKQVA